MLMNLGGKKGGKSCLVSDVCLCVKGCLWVLMIVESEAYFLDLKVTLNTSLLDLVKHTCSLYISEWIYRFHLGSNTMYNSNTKCSEKWGRVFIVTLCKGQIPSWQYDALHMEVIDCLMSDDVIAAGQFSNETHTERETLAFPETGARFY